MQHPNKAPVPLEPEADTQVSPGSCTVQSTLAFQSSNFEPLIQWGFCSLPASFETHPNMQADRFAHNGSYTEHTLHRARSRATEELPAVRQRWNPQLQIPRHTSATPHSMRNTLSMRNTHTTDGRPIRALTTRNTPKPYLRQPRHLKMARTLPCLVGGGYGYAFQGADAPWPCCDGKQAVQSSYTMPCNKQL